MLHTYPANDFKREYNILSSLVPEGLLSLFEKLEIRIAGGCITSLFSNREVNDLDLYFKSWDHLETFISYMLSKQLRECEDDLSYEEDTRNGVKTIYQMFKDLDGKSWRDCSPLVVVNVNKKEEDEDDDLYDEDEPTVYISQLGMTDKSVMFTDNKHPVMQCIAFDTFQTADDIFQKFDYTINMGAFNFKTKMWEFDSNFLKHNAQKVLVLNPGTDYPIISMLRADKYRARGYTISRRETMKLGIAVSGLHMEAWEDAKSHLSGMYGTNVETLFDETKPFSFELLLDKLDSAEDPLISHIATASEKGPEDSQFNLSPVHMFPMFQRLRKNTNRPYFTEVWGVCASGNFYLMNAHKPEHKVHLGMSSDVSPEMYSYVDFFVREEDARKLFDRQGNKDTFIAPSYRSKHSHVPGACLLKIEVDNLFDVDLDSDKTLQLPDPSKKDCKNKAVIVDLLECNGEIS